MTDRVKTGKMWIVVKVRWLFPFFATQKNRYIIGSTLTNIIVASVNFLILVKVFAPTFEYYGIPYQSLYVLLPVGFVLTNWLIGYLYERSGMWKHEWEHQIKKQNAEYLQMLKDIDLMKEWLKEMRERDDRR